MKYGILLMAFGSNLSHSKSTLAFFEQQVKKRFPEIPVRWAFTFPSLKKQYSEPKKNIHSLMNILNAMQHEQFTHIALQSLHVIAGMEYSDIVSKVTLWEKTREALFIKIGPPLLTKDVASIKRVGEAMFACIPKTRNIEEPVVFMGHGNKYVVEDKYQALSKYVNKRDPLVFLVTMTGQYRLEHILPLLQQKSQKVWLLPLLSFVGKHVLEDMVGEQTTSWKSRIESLGLTCVPIVKGLVDTPEFVEIWIEQLMATMDILSNSMY